MRAAALALALCLLAPSAGAIPLEDRPGVFFCNLPGWTAYESAPIELPSPLGIDHRYAHFRIERNRRGVFPRSFVHFARQAQGGIVDAHVTLKWAGLQHVPLPDWRAEYLVVSVQVGDTHPTRDNRVVVVLCVR